MDSAVRSCCSGPLLMRPYRSTWNYFAQDINESLILEVADAMVSTGLRDAGFRTINIDAGYMAHARNNATGSLQWNTERFPRGIRFLSDELHKRQLKIGVYTDLGEGGCGPLPGSYGHYAQDARTFARDWQVDYLKGNVVGVYICINKYYIFICCWCIYVVGVYIYTQSGFLREKSFAD